mgnify:FL=1
MKLSSRSFVVIGLGSFGSTIAAELSLMGNDVLGIDIDENIIKAQSDAIPNTAILDARDEVALLEAGVANYNVVIISIGENLEASLLTVMSVKALGVDEIWVKAKSKAHHTILQGIGVTKIIHPERDMGIRVAEKLNSPNLSDYIFLNNNQYVIHLQAGRDFTSQSVVDFIGAKKLSINILGYMNNSEFVCSSSDEFILNTPFNGVVVVGHKTELRQLGAFLL